MTGQPSRPRVREWVLALVLFAGGLGCRLVLDTTPRRSSCSVHVRGNHPGAGLRGRVGPARVVVATVGGRGAAGNARVPRVADTRRGVGRGGHLLGVQVSRPPQER